MSEYKASGLCPFCRKMVRAEVSTSNFVRRDVCTCPNCNESILVCRAPGCNDFAKGGSFWDDELCPECTKSATKMGLGVAAFIAFVASGGKSRGN